jgi:hypothetical protein
MLVESVLDFMIPMGGHMFDKRLMGIRGAVETIGVS